MTDLVAQGGYRSVTVRKLTKLAGVSTGTFYSQFDGTDDCFLATYAALMERVRAHETMLETALKESLDRRDDRVSATAVAWVTAGVLHLFRTQMAFAQPGDALELVETMARWGRQLVDRTGLEPADVAEAGGRPAPPRHLAEAREPAPADETELLLITVTKLAMTEGYWCLSESRLSKAAGVPRTHFDRRFAGVEDAYLTAVRRIVKRLFQHLAGEAEPAGSWLHALRRSILELAEEVAAAPDTARLALSGILEPGLAGLTSREALIAEIAAAWAATIPAAQCPDPLAAEAAVASLWAFIADALDDGKASRLPATSPTLAQLFLASVGRIGSGHGDRTAQPSSVVSSEPTFHSPPSFSTGIA